MFLLRFILCYFCWYNILSFNSSCNSGNM